MESHASRHEKGRDKAAEFWVAFGDLLEEFGYTSEDLEDLDLSEMVELAYTVALSSGSEQEEDVDRTLRLHGFIE